MKPGDKVICINDKNWHEIPVRCICAGLIYTVKEVFTCSCGNVYLRLIEVDKYFNMWCPGCNTYQNTKMFFHIERFRKLDENTEKNKEKESEHVEIPVKTVS